MKKIIFVFLAALIAATSAFAVPASDVTEKVLKVFHDAFPEVTQPTWYNFDGYYEVYFTNPDNTSCRIDYSPEGIVLSTIRYYGSQNLSPAIRAKVNEKFPGKKIFGVTEVSSSDMLTYHIVLEDTKSWTTVQSDAIGNLTVEKKLVKSE
ncbi:MAG: hypothetical protein ABI416_14885 [Ginsengibacter sp.]